MQVLLLGFPAAHSLSPAMQNAAFRARGLEHQYGLMEVSPDDLAGAVERLRAEDCLGANVTIPHKQAVLPLLDELEESAARVGAVNTIIKHGERLIGTNTDVQGVDQALEEAGVNVQDARVVIFGAGGAARACAFSLARAMPVCITIQNRTVARAASLAQDLRSSFPALAVAINVPDQIQQADIVVNATSLGMMPSVESSPLAPGVGLRRSAVAIDLVYRPVRTHFLTQAEDCGVRTIDGLRILVYQGAAAFTSWTGLPAPTNVMFEAVREKALE